MIIVKCNNCSIQIENIERGVNFFQPLDNSGKPQGELCKKCYDSMCKELDLIDNKFMKMKTEEETIIFNKYKLKGED